MRELARQKLWKLDSEQADAARARRHYGRGNHPARLTFGDCAAYATAKLAGQLLRYVGNDFAQTDIVSAVTRE